MTDGTIVALSLAGGFSVLMGYIFLTMTGIYKKLYSFFTSKEKNIFLVLTTLSIISYFYLFYWASFENYLEDWKKNLYIASLATYLLGASLWSIQIYKVVKSRLHPSNQTSSLLITALGTIGTLVSVGFTSSQDNIMYSFAVIASIMLVIQHAFFDLFYWVNVIHSRKKKSKV